MEWKGRIVVNVDPASLKARKRFMTFTGVAMLGIVLLLGTRLGVQLVPDAPNPFRNPISEPRWNFQEGDMTDLRMLVRRQNDLFLVRADAVAFTSTEPQERSSQNPDDESPLLLGILRLSQPVFREVVSDEQGILRDAHGGAHLTSTVGVWDMERAMLEVKDGVMIRVGDAVNAQAESVEISYGTDLSVRGKGIEGVSQGNQFNAERFAYDPQTDRWTITEGARLLLTPGNDGSGAPPITEPP